MMDSVGHWNYLSGCKLLGVPRNTPPPETAVRAFVVGERWLSVHSYRWRQVTVLVQCFLEASGQRFTPVLGINRQSAGYKDAS